ncbi:bifunctional hydroxymethylpyrimidine kinase/phosphomethylpyrimidine kinase [Sphingomonas paeninsulae]|jgi:hydroxymethylpyrimidine/phosphomethylpyrimidine kinase|uniref:hydroxymethylpyrimidine kinase n=1 Tax=Sphingomonas paeninsulae TaxID=2319844 RepID=A0A494TJ14_SPHPE|nr:bifunctional hydroxymethylpyrimidine kinase/phosphomethylpyrimidine kinase [Sphingomonas paeninsulae]AYJ85796.1 bifunctional hydroxymethylpyrimidine kinase/phosphomethylpyrimidine kinase [Sphingomonas paeninsulae]
MTARVLIIAGSDSGGGAGIQADIKTVTMLGGHAMTAIAAITAQNTTGVQAVHPVPTDMVIAQIKSCLNDIGADAIKIGMIGSAATVEAVADTLAPLSIPIVFDPVMVSTSGSRLADAATIAAFDRLIAMASVVTPNLPELEALGGEDRLVALGGTVLVKGGHANGDEVTDRLIDANGTRAIWSAPRIDTTSTHGTGCTLASAIATSLAQGASLESAVADARLFVRLSLLNAPGLGSGHGPMGQQRVVLDVAPEMRLNQITLGATDHEASRGFYQTLGLKLIVDSAPDYARFEAPGGVTLSIHRGSAGTYFECNNLDVEVARLQQAGVIFHILPTEQPWLWREAWTRDPAGNAICLYTAGESRRFPPWRV